MSRVTSKLQVTVPKLIAARFSIEPGDEIDWLPAGEAIRVVRRGRPKRRPGADPRTLRLEQFDEATARLRHRQSKAPRGAKAGVDRGWTREDLYRRGRSR
jgi:bifunctional DNA-binding transcriptional regulator/antitoxin component of YhaV-PrlF toxin-antitoxin module